MKLMNQIRQHLNEGGYRHNIDIDYDYSKVTELHAEVVKEALMEAKAQADMLADSLGLKIEGLKKAEEQGGRYTDVYHVNRKEASAIIVITSSQTISPVRLRPWQ